MKVAYIAGPYRAKTEWQVALNIHAASLVAIKYWKLGYAVICPHRNTSFFGGAADDSVWLIGDEEFVRRSDVMVMLSTWESSSGARAELKLAKELGLEIIYDG